MQAQVVAKPEEDAQRALGVSGPKRLAAMPHIPAVAETLPGFDVTVWYGVLAPARTPREVISRLHAEMLKALGHDDVRQRLVAQGFEAAGNTPAEFEAVIRADLARWQKVIRDGNIRVE